MKDKANQRLFSKAFFLNPFWTVIVVNFVVGLFLLIIGFMLIIGMNKWRNFNFKFVLKSKKNIKINEVKKIDI